MEYRVNKRTGDNISVLGFGTSYIAAVTEKDAVAAIRRALQGDFPGTPVTVSGAVTAAAAARSEQIRRRG